jgi:putative toxin-antitoxin system antitoxin component (TIGR02293 family)
MAHMSEAAAWHDRRRTKAPSRAAPRKTAAPAASKPARKPARPSNTPSVNGWFSAGNAGAFQDLYKSSLLDRIDLVKRGIPARSLAELSERMALSKEKLYQTIGVAKATMTRKIKNAQVLDKDESERTLGMAVLLGQVESMVAESGNPQGFNAATWVAAWLDRPQPALGGRRPGQLMDTADGRVLVSDLLSRMQSGAYG